MTIQQEAYRLIDSLSEDSVKAIIQVMIRMIPTHKTVVKDMIQVDHAGEKNPGMQAFSRMQELRKKTSEYNITNYEQERAEGILGKYGMLQGSFLKR